nr:hypothetical protein [Tanacetum cinerariifolium]
MESLSDVRSETKERLRVGLVYDERMCRHSTPKGEPHPENPDRIRAVWDKLMSADIPKRCVVFKAKEVDDKYIAAVHSKSHINLIKTISSKKTVSQRNKVAAKYDSIYFSEGSFESAHLAAGSVLRVAEKVAKGELNSAFAIVRPPGHHAEKSEPMGFCLYNNVAIAASFLLDQKKLGVKKILIVDWDVHHGNASQKMFWKDSRVLSFSVHSETKERLRVGLVYNERMCRHSTPKGEPHPENPDRIRAVWDKLMSAGIPKRCVVFKAKEVDDKYIAAVHSKSHINLIKTISSKKTVSQRNKVAAKYDSIYFSEGSSESAHLAAGSVLRKLGVKKILIVDWDVHHGNATQKMFWKDSRVLSFSVHRHENGSFYPGGDDGSHTMVGEGPGLGYNINVPWENAHCDEADYIAVWDHILIPVAKEFNPDIILISAGFDAAIADPLGGCCVTPHGFSILLKKLMEFNKGKIVMALEGGYNLDSLAKSVLACIEVLLEDNPIAESYEVYPFESTWRVIKDVRGKLSKFWPILATKLPKKLTDRVKPLPETYGSQSDEVLLEDDPIAESYEVYPFESTWRVIKDVPDIVARDKTLIIKDVQIRQLKDEQAKVKDKLAKFMIMNNNMVLDIAATDKTLIIKDAQIQQLKDELAKVITANTDMASDMVTKDNTLIMKDKEIEVLKKQLKEAGEKSVITKRLNVSFESDKRLQKLLETEKDLKDKLHRWQREYKMMRK